MLKMIEDGAIVYGCDCLEGSMSDLELGYERFHALYFDCLLYTSRCV